MLKFVSYIVKFHPDTGSLEKTFNHSLNVEERGETYFVTYPNPHSSNPNGTYVTGYYKKDFEQDYQFIGNLSFAGKDSVGTVHYAYLKYEGRILYEVENGKIYLFNREVTEDNLMFLINEMVHKVDMKIEGAVSKKLAELREQYDSLNKIWHNPPQGSCQITEILKEK